MGAYPDPLPFPEPAWLASYREENIDDIVAQLSDETCQLYQQYLADEVRSRRGGAMIPAWRAFDRTMCEMLRRNKERNSR